MASMSVGIPTLILRVSAFVCLKQAKWPFQDPAMVSTTLDSHFGFVSAVDVWDGPSGFTLRVATADRTG